MFDGTPRWLEISERTNGVGAFGTLAPRQLLAAAPYATYAASAGTVPGLTILQNSSGAPNVIGGSPVNWVAGGVEGATIAGGGAINYNGYPYTNSIIANFGTIGGGFQNTIQANYATIGGGIQNTIQTNAFEATIGGGSFNAIQDSADLGTIGGGSQNTIQTNAETATIGGGSGNTIRAGSGNATIGGGQINVISNNAGNATIGGGFKNIIQAGASDSTIGGGVENTILRNAGGATIPGGIANSATNYAFAAGHQAQAIHDGAFVWADNTGFFSSTANNQFAARATGGVFFQLGSANAIVQADNTTTYNDAKQLVIQGNANSSRQLELGYKTADTANYGTIQAVEQNKGFRSLVLQPSGGNVGIGTTTPAYALDVNGDINASGSVRAQGVALTSDRNAKENFTAVNARQVLAKVAALPVTQWNFKTDSQDVRHLGPMAQDFQAAFGLDGADDKHISVVDEGGVALAAIQGLNQKLEETRADNAALRADNADLRARLEKLERLLQPSK